MAESPAATMQSQAATSAATAVAVEEAEASNDPAVILGAVLAELEKAGHNSPAMELEKGTAVVQGLELIVTINLTARFIEVLFLPDPMRVANSAASAAAGRPLKLKVVSGAPSSNGAPAAVRPVRENGASARSRAANDPVVQRMAEKFGAEIRTVIDHREKN